MGMNHESTKITGFQMTPGHTTKVLGVASPSINCVRSLLDKRPLPIINYNPNLLLIKNASSITPLHLQGCNDR